MTKILFAMTLLISAALPALAADEGSMESFGDMAMVGRRVACYARNHRGFTFEAVGFDRREAERRVLERCYRTSRECFITGCRHVFLSDGQ